MDNAYADLLDDLRDGLEVAAAAPLLSDALQPAVGIHGRTGTGTCAARTAWVAGLSRMRWGCRSAPNVAWPQRVDAFQERVMALTALVVRSEHEQQRCMSLDGLHTPWISLVVPHTLCMRIHSGYPLCSAAIGTYGRGFWRAGWRGEQGQHGGKKVHTDKSIHTAALLPPHSQILLSIGWKLASRRRAKMGLALILASAVARVDIVRSAWCCSSAPELAPASIA